MFTRGKEKEALFKFEGKIKPKNAYFLMYIVGLMLYGMGSYLFLNEMLVSEFELKTGSQLLSILGILSIVGGIGILIGLFYQFYKRIVLKQKIHVALRNYLLIVLISGVLLGLFGEMIYRATDMSYDGVKSSIWILTTYIQGAARFIFIYYCLKLLVGEPFDWKTQLFKKMIAGVIVLLSISIGISLVLPVIGPMAMFLTDLIISIGIVYKQLFDS
ncbi:hypothetical protein [Enterococcus hulanensis]|uniref:hypothetical protein n=1 Tax=Enterococcus hulanensis TaxID=2559929 RepID=UPI002017E75B|nr:hypothetical protein [Enterococcus hulanensis]